MSGRTRTISALLGVGVAALFIWGIDDKPKSKYFNNEGKVFGTYYNIQYEATNNLEDSIQAAFQAFDNSLSMFNPHSVISAVNQNRDTVTDAPFEAMWTEAERVYRLSDGAFDITVAPLVNLWGFGFQHRENVTAEAVHDLLPLIGFNRVWLQDHRVIKSNPLIMLDAGAVAKGQACDMIASLLDRNGAENYLVEVGGEIVSKGLNKRGKPWRVGITKPQDDVTGEKNELQEILEVSNICMATSGNYRNFYYDGEQKRSHTIDPRTGYPVRHSLLSATIVSTTCMRADALATACMVLGARSALDMIERAGDAACYLIVSDNDSLMLVKSSNWDQMITPNP